ncbi:MAG: SdpI family protein, partial [Firmicutes bacterium]|nr:SdpI family protein [Bacillota bacterium]
VVSLVCAAVVYPYNLGYRMNITFCMMLFLGAVFTIVGNYLPKARQNYTVGIRTPWTLEDEDNWNRTHRLAGFLWVAAGLLTIVLTLLGFTNVWLTLGMIIAASIIPIIYSYAIGRNKNKTE